MEKIDLATFDKNARRYVLRISDVLGSRNLTKNEFHLPKQMGERMYRHRSCVLMHVRVTCANLNTYK